MERKRAVVVMMVMKKKGAEKVGMGEDLNVRGARARTTKMKRNALYLYIIVTERLHQDLLLLQQVFP